MNATADSLRMGPFRLTVWTLLGAAGAALLVAAAAVVFVLIVATLVACQRAPASLVGRRG